MNAIVPQQMGQISTVFNTTPVPDDLQAGVQGGFGLIGYRGKVWSIRYRGDEMQLMRDDGDGPRGSVELVILKASKTIAKNYYEAGWVDGSTAPPDCFSTNGVTPDVSSSKKQSATCATCPKNAWGSKVTEQGKQAKACADSKRLAVVPLGNIKNEAYGGPMLLRVPAASLQDLAAFGKKMSSLGYHYYSIGIRVGFDPAESFPKFTFGAIRALSDDEARLVLEMQKDDAVERILSEAVEINPAPVQDQRAAALASAFEQPPQPASQPAPAPVQVAQPTPQPTQPARTPRQPSQAGATGFGPVQSSQPVQQAPQPAQQAPVVTTTPSMVTPVGNAPAASGVGFIDDGLDAKLDELFATN